VEREAQERVSRAGEENTMALASTHEDAKGFVQKIALLEGDLAAEHQAREVSEGQCREQFEELTLLQTQGSEPCNTIAGPHGVRHHLFEGLQLAALHHTEMAGELSVLRVAVSSSTESMLGCSPSDTFHVEVVGELAAKF
jgi:hypothetical protein